LLEKYLALLALEFSLKSPQTIVGIFDLRNVPYHWTSLSLSFFDVKYAWGRGNAEWVKGGLKCKFRNCISPIGVSILINCPGNHSLGEGIIVDEIIGYFDRNPIPPAAGKSISLSQLLNS